MYFHLCVLFQLLIQESSSPALYHHILRSTSIPSSLRHAHQVSSTNPIPTAIFLASGQRMALILKSPKNLDTSFFQTASLCVRRSLHMQRIYMLVNHILYKGTVWLCFGSCFFSNNLALEELVLVERILIAFLKFIINKSKYSCFRQADMCLLSQSNKIWLR